MQRVSDLSWITIKRIVHERANGCCEYCQTCEHNIGQPIHVEHINPAGGDDIDNLCLACASCNLSKATATEAVDPQTEKIVSLYNPRTQTWQDHFHWSDEGVSIVGKTGIGRATAARLKMNQPRLIRARRNWILIGNHPPDMEQN